MVTIWLQFGDKKLQKGYKLKLRPARPAPGGAKLLKIVMEPIVK
jgi:hypothetical protein